jgi:hypothetical protein
MPALTMKMAMSIALLGAAVATAAADVVRPAEKRKFDLPPSADLSYAISAQRNGLQLSGNTTLKWSAVKGRFSIDTETTASLVGKILAAKSEGTVDEHGLAPVSFTERRLHKDVTTTSFNYGNKLISFSANAGTYPIKGGEQDRNSAIWQLIAMARATHGNVRAESEWRFLVAGQHDAEIWTFKYSKRETIHTPRGDFSALRFVKEPNDGKGQQVDIWLAPSLEWYPVRLRFTETNGDYIEQMLDNVTKSVS